MADHRTDSSIFSLISAFTSGLDVFKKLRRKRHGKQNSTYRLEDARLSQSLSKAPGELQKTYEYNYSIQGEKFREGDSKAHASLAAVLLRLNNGLVAFIQVFLSGGRKGGDLDYERLTNLSECSRLEAIDALTQLSYRLSQSSLNVMRPTTKDRSPRRSRKKDLYNDGNTAIIRRLESSNGSTPQLAIIKPRSKRSSSESRAKAHASATRIPAVPPTPLATPPASPRKRPLHNKSTPDLAYQYRQHNLPTPPPSPPDYYPPLRPRTSGGRDPLEEIHHRRAESKTPSIRTFASDSTKLGEIPMYRWHTPYDYEAMAKLNEEELLKPTIPITTAVKQKRGFFSRFRRKSADNP